MYVREENQRVYHLNYKFKLQKKEKKRGHVRGSLTMGGRTAREICATFVGTAILTDWLLAKGA